MKFAGMAGFVEILIFFFVLGSDCCMRGRKEH